MNIEEIKQYLPHRYPFLLVDRVTELVVGSHIACYKNISFNENYFQGHFPNHSIFPGVLTLEAMAQASGLLGFKTMDIKPSDSSIYIFVGADKLRFRKPIVPGDKLELSASIIQRKRNMWKFACSAKVDGELCCSSDILCAHQTIG